MTTMEIIAENIKKAREAAGMTVEELHEKSGVNGSLIAELEAGKRMNIEIITAEMIATGLGLTVAELVTEKDAAKRKARTPKGFQPPTLMEVRAYCREKMLNVDPDAFWHYFSDDPEHYWRDAKGNAVVSWKQKLLTWNRYEPKKLPTGCRRGMGADAGYKQTQISNEEFNRIFEVV